jgi:RNA recognition motif-containing protein
MNRKQARAAIRALDGTEFFGRQLKVNIANERKSAPENKEA